MERWIQNYLRHATETKLPEFHATSATLIPRATQCIEEKIAEA